MRRFDKGRGPGRRRRASITVAVLVCLLVIMLIGASLLRIAGSQRAAVLGEERMLQADWLAESGMERAAARLAADPLYAGETWPIPADALGGGSSGLVSIRVESRPDEPGLRLVTVQADYPAEVVRRMRARKQGVMRTVDRRGVGLH
jgi:hypothetical protein